MEAKHARKDDNRKSERNGLFAGFGARIARSLFFWGLAAVLASSAYTGIVRIAKERPRQQEETESAAETAAAIRETESAVETAAVGRETESTVETAAAGQDTESVVETAAVGRAEESAVETAAAGRETESALETAAVGQAAEDASAESDPAELRRVALTFDDGPHPYYTKELLDGLKERGVKATFFVVGENIPGNEDLIRRMDREGHLIGNHTYNHVKISDMNKADACGQIEKTSALIRELTGKDTEFVRPPFGEWNKELECSFVMIPVLWDVDPKDWTTNSVSDIVRRVLEDTENGDIILLHDYYESSVQAALQIVDALQGQGYEFVTVDELILE